MSTLKASSFSQNSESCRKFKDANETNATYSVFLPRMSHAKNSNAKSLGTTRMSSNGFFNSSQSTIVTNIEHYRNIYATPDNFIKRKVDYSRMKVFEEKYRKESERLKSFTEFPKQLSHLVKPIAQSGFYFIGNNMEPDKVKCIYCQGILCNWKKTDKPVNEHKRFFPTCPFLLNLNVGNDSKTEKKEKISVEDPDLIDYDGEIDYNIAKTNPTFEFDDDLEMDVEYRKKTFDISNKFKHLNHFSLNGLFLTKIDNEECVECHKCHKSVELLKGVELLPNRVFHHKNCDFINLCEVENNKIYQDQERFPLFSNDHTKQQCRVEFAITNEEVEARLDSGKINEIEKLIEFDQNALKAVMEMKLRTTGKDYDSLFELLFDLKNQKEILEVKSPSKDLEAILCDYTCVICLDKPIEAIFLPCGHFKTCQSCSVLISTCPVCRHMIERRVMGVQFCERLDMVRTT